MSKSMFWGAAALVCCVFLVGGYDAVQAGSEKPDIGNSIPDKTFDKSPENDPLPEKPKPPKPSPQDDNDQPGSHGGDAGGSGRYVALGDSYTSAPKTGKQAGGPPGCDRSDNNYPHLVAAKLKPKEFVDVSCSGATTANILSGAQNTKSGTNPPQINAVTKDTTLVTVGIGGNDVGFIGFAKECVTTNKQAPPCNSEFPDLPGKIDAAGAKVGSVLAAIHNKAPKARVVLVGYPTVLPDGDGCWPALPFTAADVNFFREALEKLNGTLKKQAKSHNADFVDTATPSKGHDACTDSDTRWVAGALSLFNAAPLHPNPKGTQGMADAVWKTIN